MAYSNYAKTIYEAFRDDIFGEIENCEIEYRDKFELGDDMPFVGKHGRGIIVRVLSDMMENQGSDNYSDRHYEFELTAIVRDSDRDQHNLTDFAEHIKYALNQNRTIATDSDYLRYVDIEYPEPETESKFKIAIITIGVLHDG